MDNLSYKAISSSFRDSCGSVFSSEGVIYRRINQNYKDDYDFLMNSGLYDALVRDNLLIPHSETHVPGMNDIALYKIIRPEKISFISYPYEWCFSQIKDAARVILKIQKISLEFGMTLKDSSAYNIQFMGTTPLLIDTLSFERYCENKPWIAYRQFCQHFFATLALMRMTDARLSQLLRIYIDGIPLDLASKLLPFGSRFNLSLLIHIHIHAWFQSHFADKTIDKNEGIMSKKALSSLINNLLSAIENMKLKSDTTVWTDYYSKTNYAAESLEHKKKLVAKFLDKAGHGTVWDLGANTGLFSRIAANMGMETISFDNNIFCVEANYHQCIKNGESKILPLLVDLTNPTPGAGWNNKERMSFSDRGPATTVLALALIHHLAISNNLPFKNIAAFFSEICTWLIIEFIPKEDSQVQRLLASRKDTFPDYARSCFENEFKECFEVIFSENITGSGRILYLMKSRLIC